MTLHDAGVERLVVLRVAPDAQVDPAAGGAGLDDGVGDGMKVVQWVREVELVVGEILEADFGPVNRRHLR